MDNAQAVAPKNANSKQNSARRHRFWKEFFTYLYMVILGIIIIYPVLITFITAFKDANVQAFVLDFGGKWTLVNFKNLFTQTLYGSWYLNTMIISVSCMVIQVIVVTLAGYVYSRYRFAGKSSV